MKLRVITATHGASPYFPAMLDSLAPVSSALEHIVVCPAGRVPPGLTSSGSRRIIVEESPGLYAAIEQGLRAPGVDWDAFTWINDDDLLAGAGCAALLQMLDTRPEIGVAYGRVALIGPRGERVGELPVSRREQDLKALLARGIMPLAQPGTVIRRSVWEKIGGFDRSYRSAGDLDFFVRALAAGVRFAFVDAEVASFRLHASQLSKFREEVAAETARALQPAAAWETSSFVPWRFRFENLVVYWERIRRHGFVSMQSLYENTK
jgi:GT2 family glycosyltransferase